MRINTNELILYKQLQHQEIFDAVTWTINNFDNKAYSQEDMISTLYRSINLLVELAVSHGFEGNLWHSYLTFLLVDNENAFSRANEINSDVSGSINYLAYNDFNIFIKLYNFNLSLIEEALGVNCFS
ncbi:MAG: AAA family ATPase, partial [Ruminiclostridium sp.]